MATDLPALLKVRNLLEGMVGRDVEVGPGTPVSPSDCHALAIYVTDALRMSAVVTTDLALAAYLGSAVALIPRGGAEAAIEDGELSPTLLDNVGEILNVFASCLNENSDDHHRLYGVHPNAASAPTDAAALAASLGHRLDLDVTVKGYGTGQLSCVLS
jgi:hypothetical protein